MPISSFIPGRTGGSARGRAIAAGAMCLASGLLAGCHKKAGPSPAAMMKMMMMAPVPVTVAKSFQRTVPQQLNAIGTVEPVASVTLESRVDGQISAVDVKQGQQVKKGALLFTLDSRTFQAALAEAQANLARDAATEKNDMVTANEEKQLIGSQNATREEYELAMFTAQAQAAKVKADQALVRSAQLQLSYCKVRAPMNGKAGSLLAFQGALVKANTTPLILINEISPIYVSFTLPEQNLDMVTGALARSGKAPIAVKVAETAGGPTQATGHLSFINNEINTQTGSITLKATFPNTKETLWPGEYVNVRLTVANIPHAVLVPSQAVNTGQSGYYCYVVLKGGAVKLQPVWPGLRFGPYRVISKGLKAGQIVVTDGQLKLFPGKRVTVRTPHGSKGKGMPAPKAPVAMKIKGKQS